MAAPRSVPAPWVRRAGRLFQILAVLLLPGLFIRYAHGNIEINDFSVYYTAARAVLEGVDPYLLEGPNGRPFVYPPGFAVLIAPLACLPFAVAATLWTALGFTAVFASLWFCLDLLGVSRGASAWAVGGLTLVCSGRMLDSELGNGQANHWVLLGIAASAWLVARGRATLAGFALAIAIVAKVTPLLLVVYFAARRQWRVCAGVAAGIVVMAGLLPALALGPRAALEANLAWTRIIVHPLLPGTPRSFRPDGNAARRAHGYSLRAFLQRHLSATQAASHHDEPVFVNSVSWSRRTLNFIYLASALLLLAATALALGAHRPRDSPRWLLEIASVAATMVLIAPLARKAHFVVLLLPFAIGVTRTLQKRSPAAALWIVPPALVFVSTASGVIGKPGAAHALAWGAYTIAAFWLWAGALLVSWRNRRGD